jgi:hypothetical protein
LQSIHYTFNVNIENSHHDFLYCHMIYKPLFIKLFSGNKSIEKTIKEKPIGPAYCPQSCLYSFRPFYIYLNYYNWKSRFKVTRVNFFFFFLFLRCCVRNKKRKYEWEENFSLPKEKKISMMIDLIIHRRS